MYRPPREHPGLRKKLTAFINPANALKFDVADDNTGQWSFLKLLSRAVSQLDDFGYDISLPETASADDPISLFTLYYAPEIIEQLVEYTN
jgi:hypothetical protein